MVVDKYNIDVDIVILSSNLETIDAERLCLLTSENRTRAPLDFSNHWLSIVCTDCFNNMLRGSQVIFIYPIWWHWHMHIWTIQLYRASNVNWTNFNGFCENTRMIVNFLTFRAFAFSFQRNFRLRPGWKQNLMRIESWKYNHTGLQAYGHIFCKIG